MKQNQRVYIKGDSKRGKEVIKFLEKLGGRNAYHFDGHNIDAYYFITPKGVIANSSPLDKSGIFSYVKEFYKEIKLPRWKPKYNELYYSVSWSGRIMSDKWYGTWDEELSYQFGNCFRTKKEAIKAKDKIKEMINK